MLKLRRALAVLVATVAVAFCATAFASTTDRIGVIDLAQQTILPGSVPVAMMHAKDLGPASGDKQLAEMSLRFTTTKAQQTALAQLLSDQQNPKSPRFHQWLTPEQFGAQFGLSASDLAKVQTWLTAQGFTVTETARGGSFVRFSGTVAQAQAAFHTSVHNVVVDGEPHISNVSAVSLPVALANVTGVVTGLADFKLKPRQHFVAPASASISVPVAKPLYTSTVSGNHFLVPGDFHTIYDENSLLTGGLNGSGVTIAVLGQTDVTLSDVANFRSLSGLSVNTPTVKLYGADPGTPSQGDYLESMLDLEWSGATAPSASILFVNSTNVIDGSLTDAIDNNLAPIISISYGDCESEVGSTNLANYNGLVQQANAEGITVVAAAGDSGATDCDYQVASATGGLAVDFPASMPNVTGVGGTMFAEGAGTYWSATNNSDGSSALSYIPEEVWNEDAVFGQLASGGGGASMFFTKPYWQTGTGVPADFSRDVPDVALNAAAEHDPYLICTSGYCINGFRASNSDLDAVGGTSVGAPSFAGLLAVVVQKTGARLGNANPVIYALGDSTFASSVFHDIVSGNNESPCTAGSTGCPTGGSIGYAAGPGYDLASGWGTIDAFNLVNDWSLVTPATNPSAQDASQTNLSGNVNSTTAGTPVLLTATVASNSSSAVVTPTGSVQFLVDNVAVGSSVSLTNGVATYSLDTTNIAAGSHIVTAAYSGDATYAGSKGAFELSITSANAADFTLTPSVTNLTVPSGTISAGVPFTVTALNGFTGTITFDSAAVPSSLIATGYFTPATVTLSSTTTNGIATYTLVAYQTEAKGSHPQYRAAAAAHAAIWYGSGVAFAGLLMLMLPRKRKLPALLAVLISVIALGSTGCGLNNIGSLPPEQINAVPGNYTLLITATGTTATGTTTHSATINLLVD